MELNSFSVKPIFLRMFSDINVQMPSKESFPHSSLKHSVSHYEFFSSPTWTQARDHPATLDISSP